MCLGGCQGPEYWAAIAKRRAEIQAWQEEQRLENLAFHGLLSVPEVVEEEEIEADDEIEVAAEIDVSSDSGLGTTAGPIQPGETPKKRAPRSTAK